MNLMNLKIIKLEQYPCKWLCNTFMNALARPCARELQTESLLVFVNARTGVRVQGFLRMRAFGGNARCLTKVGGKTRSQD